MRFTRSKRTGRPSRVIHSARGAGGASLEFIGASQSNDVVPVGGIDQGTATLPGGTLAGDMAVVLVGYDQTTAETRDFDGDTGWTELAYQIGTAQTSGAMFWKVLDAGNITAGSITHRGGAFAEPGFQLLVFRGATSATNIDLVSLSGTGSIDTSAASGVLIQYATNYSMTTVPLVNSDPLTRIVPDRTGTSSTGDRPRVAAAYGDPIASVTGGPNGAAWGVHGACYIT